ncbi:peptidase M56 BlaR1 [Lysinibacillus xylanilyticus]|uniref:peptidase M56 BlaR1 n=1 Tax=Lysinibacillus xylanilyticus TaxID=582475 RepID=UPI0038006426
MFKRNLVVSSVLVLGIIIGAFFFGNSLTANINDNSKNEMKNGQGLTYGSASDASSYEDEPDLIRAIGIDGTTGYVKKDDLNGPQPKTPEEAARLTNEAKPKEIPLYDVKGETIIGKFIVGG